MKNCLIKNFDQLYLLLWQAIQDDSGLIHFPQAFKHGEKHKCNGLLEYKKCHAVSDQWSSKTSILSLTLYPAGVAGVWAWEQEFWAAADSRPLLGGGEGSSFLHYCCSHFQPERTLSNASRAHATATSLAAPATSVCFASCSKSCVHSSHYLLAVTQLHKPAVCFPALSCASLFFSLCLSLSPSHSPHSATHIPQSPSAPLQKVQTVETIWKPSQQASLSLPKEGEPRSPPMHPTSSHLAPYRQPMR